MTLLVAATLVGLALVDGAFSGFRASLGRSGLVDHRAKDRHAMKRGTGLVAMLAIPAIAAFVLDVSLFGQAASVYTEAGHTFLTVVTPYALVVAVALGAYAALGWELKYVAAALILGPFALIRPYMHRGRGCDGAAHLCPECRNHGSPGDRRRTLGRTGLQSVLRTAPAPTA